MDKEPTVKELKEWLSNFDDDLVINFNHWNAAHMKIYDWAKWDIVTRKSKHESATVLEIWFGG